MNRWNDPIFDATLRSIFSAADETIAQLEQLHAADRARRADLMAQQRAIVARLDVVTSPDQDEETAELSADRRDRAELRRRPQEVEQPFVALPERTTPGGPFGSKVEAKLRRIALGEERGW